MLNYWISDFLNHNVPALCAFLPDYVTRPDC